jgi:hypothetical protein
MRLRRNGADRQPVERSGLLSDPRFSPHGYETTERRQYSDVLLVDRLRRCNWIDDRQHAAAAILCELFFQSGLESRTVATYEKQKRGRSTKQQNDDEPQPLDSWLRVGDEFEYETFSLISRLVRNQNPGVHQLASVRAVLDRAADLLGLPKAGGRW